MQTNPSLARWCAYLGIVGIGIGILVGILGLMHPSEIYGAPPDTYLYVTPAAKTVARLNGLMLLCFTAAFLGYSYTGAVGHGALGMIATWLSLIGNLGTALSFFHAARIEAQSPLFSLGFLLLPGWILLTVAALRNGQVSRLEAWWPVVILIGLMAIEYGIGANGISVMVHDALYGSIAFITLAILGKQPARQAAAAV